MTLGTLYSFGDPLASAPILWGAVSESDFTGRINLGGLRCKSEVTSAFIGSGRPKIKPEPLEFDEDYRGVLIHLTARRG